MKRTLFNTVMGCLAALSLAGCGGSGSGGSGASSSGPSESLIGGGFDYMKLESKQSNDDFYYEIFLRPGQSCSLSLLKNGETHHSLPGTWRAESLGNGEFKLFLTGFPNEDKGCTISVNSSVKLTIPNYSKYREGEQEVDAELDSAPFTHNSGTGCKYSGSANLNCTVKQGVSPLG